MKAGLAQRLPFQESNFPAGSSEKWLNHECLRSFSIQKPNCIRKEMRRRITLTNPLLEDEH